MLSPELRDPKGNRLWQITIQPAVEPVSVDEIKLFGRIDTTEEDSLIAGFISDARKRIEDYLERALINQTIQMTLDYWDCKIVELPRAPLSSVTSIVTIDEDDTETTYSSDNYYVMIDKNQPGRIAIKQDVSLPKNTERTYGGFKITYVAGYGSTPTQVPDQIRISIMYLATLLYEKRGMVENMPDELKTKLYNYVVMRKW